MANLIIGSQDPLAKQAELISENANSIVLAQSIATVATTPGANNVTVSTSVNNDSGDTVTVYTTPGTISVSSVDQTINQYLVSDSGVSSIVAGNNVTITSSAGNGQGTVTINAVVSTVNTVATANTVINNAQPNITSVGTLTSLGVSGTIIAGNVIANTGIFSGNGSGLTNLVGGNVTGTVPIANNVSNASQPNVTSLGNLTSLIIGNTSNANTVVFSFDPNGQGLLSNTTGFTFVDQASPGNSKTFDFVRVGNTLNSPSNVWASSAPNITSASFNFKVYNGNTFPSAVTVSSFANDLPNYSQNTTFIPGTFSVYTGNPLGNLNANAFFQNQLRFDQYGQLEINNNEGGNSQSTVSGLFITGYSNNANVYPLLYTQKYRGNITNQLPVQASDRIGGINFNAFNGGNVRGGATIYAKVRSDANITTGNLIPTDIFFDTNGGNVSFDFFGNGNVIVNSNIITNGLYATSLNNSNTTEALFYNTGTGEITYDTVGTLQGAQGIQGVTGSQGIQGTTGSTGIQGTTGSIGIQGTSGAIGIQGTTGSTGIQGTTGSTGIQGTTGSTGIQGITGSIGIQGTSGAIGIQGTTGSTGIQGTTGSIGIQGTTGLQGIQSTQGLQGIQGIQGPTNANTLIWTSAPGTSSSTGTPGQVAYATGFFYVCVAPDTWERATLATW